MYLSVLFAQGSRNPRRNVLHGVGNLRPLGVSLPACLSAMFVSCPLIECLGLARHIYQLNCNLTLNFSAQTTLLQYGSAFCSVSEQNLKMEVSLLQPYLHALGF
jgi:hypothetical protein